MKLRVGYCSRWLLAAVAILLCNFAFAQRTLSGKITDKSNGEALIGANILVVGTSTGTVTDFDGSYTLEVPAGATELEISYTGYTTQRVTIGSATTMDIALAAGQLLDEVVVTGYGTAKAREVTSAIVSVKAKDFNGGNVTSAAQLLQGKVAGLSISRPGGNPNEGFAIRLRGLSTLGANSSPLIVIDGIIGGSLDNVDPNDIDNITVLKDASAAAIYGTRGASGVLLITTKKGQAGKFTVDYNGFLSSTSRMRTLPIMTAAEWREIPSLGIPAANLASFTDRGASTDWVDAITQTAIGHTHNLSMSGGTRDGNYRVSFNVRDNEGVLRTTGRESMNGRFTFNQNALDGKLRLSSTLSITNTKAGFGFNDAMRYALLYNPTAPIRSTAADNARFGGYYEENLFDYFNPVSIVEQNVNEGELTNFLGSLQLEYDLTKDLKVSGFYSRERNTQLNGQYLSRTAKFGGGADSRGIANRLTNQQTTQQATFTATYSKDFGKLDFRLLAGYEYQSADFQGLGSSAFNFLTDVFGYNRLGDALSYSTGQSSAYSYRNGFEGVAMFSRLNLSFDDTYNLMVSVRREGNSRFGEGNKYAVFPGFGIGADLVKAMGLDFADALKLRVSYGVAGNLPGESYLSIQRFGQAGRFFYNGAFVPSYAPVSNPNPNLKWEKQADLNIGLDFSFMNYRLNGSLDLFNRTTSDLLYFAPVPVPPNLFPNTWLNLGEMQNTGLELALNYNVIKKQNFSYDLSLTPTFYFSNKLVSLSSPDFAFGSELFLAGVGSPGLNETNMIRVTEGGDIGDFWGPIYDGVNDNGTWKFKDLNGDGKITRDDDTKIGNGLPDLELGWGNSFKVDQLDINLFFRGVFGHDLINQYRIFYETLNTLSWNRVKADDYFNPKLTDGARFSSYQVEKGSFLKLDNATVGYTFNLKPGSSFNKVRLYLAGQNLFVLTKYSGADPEIRLADIEQGGANAILSPGIDRRNTYYMTRTMTFGLNLGF
ncbi:MAG: SusC/RagA family TonB-linked outer membrane protein [Haliscomenobacter sp.]|uniref:SusC/RagA family TonB-linked outer membrane protein n=1 Tax=Haliscomenobacter sp. TaxID=2717303 RepID=UPI0029A7E328|nr:SusC/RagA family TonB-linked outer membrane protein [Haliscomenobacter sp.]MDX2067154.1 SusC/RagA family TonB-linked outer membrane protein [Haliscomenobacter sp.]